MENPLQQPSIDLSKTTPITTKDGNKIFQQGALLRKVSKFITGTTEDAIMPIPVFFDPITNKILSDSVPPALKDEFTDEELI